MKNQKTTDQLDGANMDNRYGTDSCIKQLVCKLTINIIRVITIGGFCITAYAGWGPSTIKQPVNFWVDGEDFVIEVQPAAATPSKMSKEAGSAAWNDSIKGTSEEEFLWNASKMFLLEQFRSADYSNPPYNYLSDYTFYTIDSNLRSRVHIMYNLFPETTKDMLIDLMNDSNEKVRQLAIFLIVTDFIKGRPGLTPILTGQRLTKEFMIQLNTKLVSALEDPSPGVRTEAARALMDLDQGGPQMLHFMKYEPDLRVRFVLVQGVAHHAKAKHHSSAADQMTYLRPIIDLIRDTPERVLKTAAILTMPTSDILDPVVKQEVVDLLLSLVKNKENRIDFHLMNSTYIALDLLGKEQELPFEYQGGR